MFKCNVCGKELPNSAEFCTNCLVYQAPPAKFKEGDIVKINFESEGYAYYNRIVGSYYNHDVDVRMYRLQEPMMMPIWREDWLLPVSDEEIASINKSGKLKTRKSGGWEHPIMEGVTK